jgi:hypothetical protein
MWKEVLFKSVEGHSIRRNIRTLAILVVKHVEHLHAQLCVIQADFRPL